MQKNRHFVKIEEACGGSRNFFSPRPCRQIDESICKDVSVWITVLRGSVSPAQHIISGRLQVMCSFWIYFMFYWLQVCNGIMRRCSKMMTTSFCLQVQHRHSPGTAAAPCDWLGRGRKGWQTRPGWKHGCQGQVRQGSGQQGRRVECGGCRVKRQVSARLIFHPSRSPSVA